MTKITVLGGRGFIGSHLVKLAANCVFSPVNHEFSARDRLIHLLGRRK